MKKASSSYIIILMIFVGTLIPMSVSSQIYRFSQSWKIGGTLGATKFYGDLTDNTNSFLSNTPFSKYFYQDRKIGGAFFIEKSISPYFGIRGMFFGGKVKSTQESSKQYFEANYVDYTISLTLDFGNMLWGPNNGKMLGFYGLAGIGMSESRTWKYDSNTGNIIATNGFGEPKQEGGSLSPMTEVVFPVGLGLTLFNYSDVNVIIEGCLHIVKTNKLDATPVDGTRFESVGVISIGLVYNFNMNGLTLGRGGHQSFEGRSNDPALREFNKRKRVVMRTKMNRKAFKKRKRFRHQRR